jgi:hypothetical protein
MHEGNYLNKRPNYKAHTRQKFWPFVGIRSALEMNCVCPDTFTRRRRVYINVRAYDDGCNTDLWQ